jgi:asparagine synthetase B (glutamine-hydrolysing)
VTADANGARVSRYWSLSEIPETTADRDGGVEACAAALQEAIGDRLEGASCAGMTLSGGWDSGVIFSLWQWMRTRQPRLPAPWFYTYYGDTPEADERAAVRALLERWPAGGQFAPLHAAGALSGLGDHIARLGLPETASGWRWFADMGAAARRQGIAMLLTGEGGNEVFRSSILEPLALLRADRGLEALRQIAAWVREIDSTALRFTRRYVLGPALDLWAPRIRDAWRRDAVPAYLTDEAREMARGLLADAARRRRERYQDGSPALWERRLNLEAWWDELFPLSYALDLEGVSASVPFLDRRVILAALPALSAPRHFESTRDLPAAVLRATTGQPFEGRYAHYTRFLNQALESVLPRFDAAALAELGIVHPGRLRKFIAAGPDPAPLWPLISAETWARRCLLGA